MKILKTKKYSQQQVSYREIFNEILQKNNGDVNDAANKILDISTNGLWAGWDDDEIEKAKQQILYKFYDKKITTASNKKAEIQGFVRIQPSSSNEGLFEILVSSYGNPNLGGQVLKENLSLEEANKIGEELAKRWEYKLVTEDLSSNQRYHNWIDNNNREKKSVLSSRIVAQVKSNPLDGKSNQQARSIVNRKIIPQEQIKGFFTDDSWQGIQQIWNAFNTYGLDWDIMGSNYYPNGDNPMGGKIWNIEINFINNKGKPTKLHGTVTAAGAGTVEDPLSRYDITAYVG